MSKNVIDSVPNEVLENIFEVGAHLPMPVDDNYPHRPLFSKLPLAPLYPSALSQVCIRWREISLQMPVVWSFLHLSRSSSSHKRLKSDIRRSLEWVPTYLTRSAALPLHITVDMTRLPSSALCMVLSHSARWESLTLLVSHVGNLPSILPIIQETRTPHLKSLTVASDIYREGIISYDPMPPFLVESTPDLSTIQLVGAYIGWNAPPLSHLVNLELRFTSRWPSFNQLRDMFGSSPMLRRLVIQDEISTILRHVEQPQSKPTIALQSLRYLDIQVYRIRDARADVAALMGLFNTPLLEALILKDLWPQEWSDVSRKYALPLDPQDFDSLEAGSAYRRGRLSFPMLSKLMVTDLASPRNVKH